MLFPLLMLVFRGRSIAARVAAVLAIAAIVQLVHAAIILYFSIWLLGVAFSRVKIEVGPALRWTLLFLFVGTAVVIRVKGVFDVTPEGYPQYLLFSLVFVVFLSSMQFKRAQTPLLNRMDRIGRFFASFSFTLYVLHVPMIVLMLHFIGTLCGISQLSPHVISHYLIYVGMYFVLVLGANWFSLPFESNTSRVRQWLKTRLTGHVGTVRTRWRGSQGA